MTFSHSLAKASRHTQTKRSPTTALRPQAYANKEFSHSLAEASECALPPTLFTCLAKVRGCAQSTQMMPVGFLALVVKRVHVLRLRSTSIGKSSWQTTSHRTTVSRLKYTPSFPIEMGLCDLLVTELQLQSKG